MNFRIALNSTALPLWLQCRAHVEGDTGEPWIVDQIELYADPGYVHLVADDVEFDRLPAESQELLRAAIETEYQRCRRPAGWDATLHSAREAAFLRIWDEALTAMSQVRS